MRPIWDPYISKLLRKDHYGTHIKHCDNKSFVYHPLQSLTQYDVKYESNIKPIFSSFCTCTFVLIFIKMGPKLQGMAENRKNKEFSEIPEE